MTTPTIAEAPSPLPEFEFQAWPKIARLNRRVVVTEKIDGTNAAVIVQFDGDHCSVGAQSRKRVITPEDDNFGFARWVDENAIMLADVLGHGYHFGEWWGSGIQRGYGLPKGEKRFSLFNTSRWDADDLAGLVPGLGVVPVLYDGPFDTDHVQWALDDLAEDGSKAAPGFMDPEGIVLFHTAANLCLKATIKNDESPKELAA